MSGDKMVNNGDKKKKKIKNTKGNWELSRRLILEEKLHSD